MVFPELFDLPFSVNNGRNIGSGVVWRLDDDDCSASTPKVAFAVVDAAASVDVDGALVAGASEVLRVGSNTGETDLDGMDALLSIRFEEMLSFRSSIGSVDAGRLSRSRGSSMIGEYDRLISIDCADDNVFVDGFGCCSAACSFAFASTCCCSFESFASSSAYILWRKKIKET